MTDPKDLRPIANGAYRATRAYFADHVFFQVPGGGLAPSDLLGQEAWEHLMDAPTDVLLRTTDYLGTMVDDMITQAGAWMRAIPTEPTKMPFMFDVAIDAHDEFCAAPFAAAHGWYRQATASLRNALEVMAHGTRFAVLGDKAKYQAWRTDTAVPPKFGNSIEIIGQNPTVAAVNATLGAPGLFGTRQAPGVFPSLHDDLCRYAHSRPGYTNGDIWKSNGPVFIPKAFTQFWLDFCDTLLACYVLLKIGYPQLVVPEKLDGVAGNAGATWHGIAEATMAAFFPQAI